MRYMIEGTRAGNKVYFDITCDSPEIAAKEAGLRGIILTVILPYDYWLMCNQNV